MANAVSHSAPLVELQQYEQELENLTKEQRDLVSGRDAQERELRNEEDITPKELEDFHNALDALPLEDKQDYLRAMINAPELFEAECHPIHFFRVTDWNAREAAVKSAAYWKLRLEVFGEELAFLPLTLEGAMRDDIDTMQRFHNYIRICPPDQHGRFVISTNKNHHSGLAEKRYRKYKIRFQYYLINIALEQRRARLRGVVVVCLSRSQGLFDRKEIQLGARFWNCAPLKLCCFHLFNNPSAIATQWIPYVMYLMRKSIRNVTIFHIASNAEHRQRTLSSYGFARECLPSDMGGTYEPNSFSEGWMHQRLEIEQTPSIERMDMAVDYGNAVFDVDDNFSF